MNHDENTLIRIRELRRYYNILLKWVNLIQHNRTVVSFFKQLNYLRVAIYGCGRLERLLYTEIHNNILLCYLILDGSDREFINNSDIVSFSLEDNLPEVDVLIVNHMNISLDTKSLKSVFTCPVVALEEIVNSI